MPDMGPVAVVLGGASCLWDDVMRLGRLDRFVVVVVNEVGCHVSSRIDHWVSLHPENMAGWKARRPGNADYTSWSHRDSQYVDRVVDHWGGSSGLFGARVAFAAGCERVILCGVPLDERPHFHTSDQWGTGPWRDAKIHRGEVAKHIDRWKNVRSMSGWTAQILGTPDEEWIRGEAARAA